MLPIKRESSQEQPRPHKRARQVVKREEGLVKEEDDASNAREDALIGEEKGDAGGGVLLKEEQDVSGEDENMDEISVVWTTNHVVSSFSRGERFAVLTSRNGDSTPIASRVLTLQHNHVRSQEAVAHPMIVNSYLVRVRSFRREATKFVISTATEEAVQRWSEQLMKDSVPAEDIYRCTSATTFDDRRLDACSFVITRGEGFKALFSCLERRGFLVHTLVVEEPALQPNPSLRLRSRKNSPVSVCVNNTLVVTNDPRSLCGYSNADDVSSPGTTVTRPKARVKRDHLLCLALKDTPLSQVFAHHTFDHSDPSVYLSEERTEQQPPDDMEFGRLLESLVISSQSIHVLFVVPDKPQKAARSIICTHQGLNPVVLRSKRGSQRTAALAPFLSPPNPGNGPQVLLGTPGDLAGIGELHRTAVRRVVFFKGVSEIEKEQVRRMLLRRGYPSDESATFVSLV